MSTKCLNFYYMKELIQTMLQISKKEVISAYDKNGDLASKIWTVFVNKVMNIDVTKFKELEEKFDLMYLVNSLLSSGGEEKANIEKMLPFTMMCMEKVRQYKNELTEFI